MHCKICLKKFNKIMFDTKRVKICGVCIRQLNDNNRLAHDAFTYYKEKLKIGIQRRIAMNLNSDDPWKRNQALIDQMVLDLRVDESLENWVLKIIQDENNNIEAKMIRAYKLGILRYDLKKKDESKEYWNKIRTRVGKEDNWECHKCKRADVEMHIHHLIHRSRFGTSNKKNLITLCKTCHEDIHQRIFEMETVN